MTVIYMPPFQRWAGHKVEDVISNRIHTKVHVGTIQIGFPNRVIIDNVIILDQQQKKMLRIGRLSTKMQWIPLLEGQIVIPSAQLFGAHVNIYQTDSLAPLNIQFVIDALTSSDTTQKSPLDLRINSLIVRQSNISFERKYISRKNHLDLNHLTLNDISSHVILKTLTNDSLSVHVKRLTFNEKSNLNVKTLAFKLNAGRHNAILKDLTLQMPHSTLSIDSLEANYDLDKMAESLRYRLNNLNADVRLSDLRSLYPKLASNSEIVNLQTTIEGTSQNVIIPRMEIKSSGKDLRMSLNGWIFGLEKKAPDWKIDVSSLSATENILQTITNQTNFIPHQLINLGNLEMSGIFKGNEDGNIEANSQILTSAGDLSIDFTMNKGKVFAGKITTKGIDLGKLLENNHLGKLVTDLKLSGTTSDIYATGTADKIEFKGYSYHNINFQARYSIDEISGKIEIDDPNIRTLLAGKWQKNQQHSGISLTGNINRFCPQALHISDNWGKASFSAAVDADIIANTINDAEGTMTIRNFVMNDSTDLYKIDSIQIVSGFEKDIHFVKLTGEIGKAELRGHFDFNTLPKSLISIIGARLPSIPGLPAIKESLNNEFNIDLFITNSEWMRRLLNIPLMLNAPILLKGNINDLTHRINIKGNMPAFHYNNSYYEDANLLITTYNDSIICRANVEKQLSNNLKMNLALNTVASNNRINTGISWDNHTQGINQMQGALNIATQLYTNEQGKPEAHIHTQSSKLTLGGAQWNINPSDIIITDDRILFDHFSIEHNQQHLLIDGIASKLPKDSILVDMKGIDVSYVMDLVNFHPVDFSGFVTGRAYASHLLDTPQARADITVEGFRFEGGRMGTLHAQAEWNNREQQIDIYALADDGLDAKTYINGYVSPVRNDIELNIKGEGTHIDFLHNYTRSFLKDVGGHAYGELKLVGPLGAMDLLGTLVVNGQATVIPLGTTYTLRNDTVRLIHNDILLNRAAIYDTNDDVAYLSGGIHHENLSNMTFDLDVVTDKFLAYNQTELGNETFCGSVTANGKVELHGRPGEIVINCNATPLRSTTFTYNAALSNEVSRQDFITWHDKNFKAVSNSSDNNQQNQKRNIPTDIYINFLINANPDATVKLLMDAATGDYITLYGSGVLRASYHNKGAFQMFGTYTVDNGTYGITIQNIIKKNFVFKNGSTLVFGGNPMDANLQLQALYTVNGVSLSDLNIGNSFSNNTVRVNCIMNITGQAGAPQVDFDLDIPNVNSEEKQMVKSVITSEQEMNQQVLYLLGIGRFYTQGVNNAETQEYGQTQLAMQSFLSGTLSTQINELISQVFKNEDWNFGANISTGNEGWHNAEYEGLISGRMLNNRLLINGQFGYRDNATQATPSFIGDFDIRYILTPNGNLALKMYNQTNDRYFTRSSLNTQGLGLIIKKDFNSIGDFFSRKKKDVVSK